MVKKKVIKGARDTTENVRIGKSVVDMARKNKDKTSVPIGKFFEIAALEKLGKGKN